MHVCYIYTLKILKEEEEQKTNKQTNKPLRIDDTGRPYFQRLYFLQHLSQKAKTKHMEN